MKNIRKMLGFGVLTRLIPFLISIPLNRNGELIIDMGLFKSLMVIVGTLIGVYLLVVFFQKITANYVQRGIKVGVVWLIINLILDFLTLVAIFHTPISEYLMGTGLRYLSILIIAIGIGYALKQQKK